MTRNTVTEPLEKIIPLRRFGKTEEVADAALFLASTEYITGEVEQCLVGSVCNLLITQLHTHDCTDCSHVISLCRKCCMFKYFRAF